MPDPEISVIIPVYNGERFLAEALASVAAQTYRPIEVIVADDGSTDGSAALAEVYSGTRCLKLPHLGVSAARNSAIGAARGDWLAFLDCDDIWLPDRLAVQVAAMAAFPGTAVFLGRKRILIDGPRPAWYDGPGTGADLPSYEPSTWLVRRDAFEAAGMFDTSMTIGEDTEWLARATDAGLGIHVCERVIMERRIHDTNASGSKYDRKGLMLNILRDSVRRKRPVEETG